MAETPCGVTVQRDVTRTALTPGGRVTDTTASVTETPLVLRTLTRASATRPGRRSGVSRRLTSIATVLGAGVDVALGLAGCVVAVAGGVTTAAASPPVDVGAGRCASREAGCDVPACPAATGCTGDAGGLPSSAAGAVTACCVTADCVAVGFVTADVGATGTSGGAAERAVLDAAGGVSSFPPAMASTTTNAKCRKAGDRDGHRQSRS